MKNQFLDNIKTMFESKEKLSPEQLQNLMTETTQYFASLHEKMQSGDARAQEEATASAMELKGYLESQLLQWAALPQDLSEEERASLQSLNDTHSAARKTNKLKPIKMS